MAVWLICSTCAGEGKINCVCVWRANQTCPKENTHRQKVTDVTERVEEKHMTY